MRTFSLTSAAFQGEVTFEFNDLGLLTSFDTKAAELSEQQQIFLLKGLPRELAEVTKMLERSPNAKFVETTQEINFDMFWRRYSAPLNSKKKKAEQRWGRMSKAEQRKAYLHIGKYEMNLQGVAKMYAETYLNSELWNN